MKAACLHVLEQRYEVSSLSVCLRKPGEPSSRNRAAAETHVPGTREDEHSQKLVLWKTQWNHKALARRAQKRANYSH